MDSLEDELNDALRLDIAPIIDEIKAEGGGLEGLSRIIEQVVMPLVSAQKAAILRLAREVDELRLEIAEKQRGE
jgi:hypothetical protein